MNRWNPQSSMEQPSRYQERGGQIDPQRARPDTGLSLLVGKNSDVLVEQMGKPDGLSLPTMAMSGGSINDFQFMVGVKDGQSESDLSAKCQSDVTPFEIGQEIEEIYRSTIIESEIVIQMEENIYTFTLNSEDVKSRS